MLDELSLPEVERFVATQQKSPELIAYSPEKISPELLAIAEEVGNLTGTWNPVEFCAPTADNVAGEKKIFFEAFQRNQSYYPHFIYDIAESMDVSKEKIALENLRKKLREFKPEAKNEQERMYRIALYFKIQDDLSTCELIAGIQNRNEKLIHQAYDTKYPPINDQLLLQAEKTYDSLLENSMNGIPQKEKAEPLLNPSQQELVRKSQFNAPQIKEAFEWLLDQNGLLRKQDGDIGFTVVIDRRARGIDVRDKSAKPMTIYVPEDRIVNGEELLILMVHEIEGHARQSVNGIKMFGVGSGELKIDDETLYEGLAMRLEGDLDQRLFGTENGIPEPWYAIAAGMASNGGGFYEIFKDQFERQMRVSLRIPKNETLKFDEADHEKEIQLAKEKAWKATYRVMKGHTDTSNPEKYAQSKDLGYLRGWMIDHQLRQAGYEEVNEMAIMMTGGLQLLAHLNIDDISIPHPFRRLTEEYCLHVLLPKLESQGSYRT